MCIRYANRCREQYSFERVQKWRHKVKRHQVAINSYFEEVKKGEATRTDGRTESPTRLIANAR